MTRYQTTIWCDGCGVEITWTPYLAGKCEYCCEDCWYGLLCDCASRIEMEEDRRKELAAS